MLLLFDAEKPHDHHPFKNKEHTIVIPNLTVLQLRQYWQETRGGQEMPDKKEEEDGSNSRRIIIRMCSSSEDPLVLPRPNSLEVNPDVGALHISNVIAR